jgi:hypothetical protein
LKIPKGGNQNRYIEEEQTTQWPEEKAQKDKQRSTKHTHKTKDRIKRAPLKVTVLQVFTFQYETTFVRILALETTVLSWSHVTVGNRYII